MGFIERIQALFDIRPDEGWTVARILLFSFFQSLALAFLFTTANVLFLAQVSVSTLPYVYISTATLLLLLEVVTQRMEAFITLRKMVLLILSVLLVSMLLFSAAIKYWHTSSVVLFLLIIWEKASSLTAGGELGKVNAMIFDIRQSKRLFGLLGSAEIPARIIGLLVAPLLLDYVKIQNLLLVSAFFFAVAIFFYHTVSKRHIDKLDVIIAPSKEEGEAHEVRTLREKIKHLFGGRYILLLSIFFFCMATAGTFVEFSFLTSVQERLKDGEQQALALFLGIFLSAGEATNFVFKTFFSGRIINRYGIKFALRILPFGLFLFCALFFGSELFFQNVHLWVIVFMMFYNNVSKASFADPAFFSLFQPLSQKERFEGYGTVGVTDNVALLFSGLVLLAITSLGQMINAPTEIVFITLLLVALSIVWGVGGTIDREYHNILESALQNRSIEGNSLNLEDSSSAELLRQRLNSQHLGEVLYALSLLVKFGHHSLSEEIPRMLAHPSQEVKLQTLKLIEQYRLISFAPHVRELISQTANVRLRYQAITVYTSIAEDDFFEEIHPLLLDSHEEVKMGAMIGLIKSGGINGVIAAGERLIELSGSVSAKDRAFAAFIVGEVGIQNFYQPLLRLLDDPAPEVRKAAMEAAGKIGNSRLAKPLVERLGEQKMFESAVRSLIRMGEKALPYLETVLAPGAEDNWKKPRRAAYISGRIGGRAAVALLKSHLSAAQPEVRNQVFESLSSNTFHVGNSEDGELQQYIRRELEEATFMIFAMKKLKERDMGILLVAALDTEVRQSISRLMLLLSFAYNAQSLRRVRMHLFGADKEKRANAIELLDLLLPGQLKWQIFPLLEDLPLMQKVEKMQEYFPQPNFDVEQVIGFLVSDKCNFVNAWTKSVAIYTLKDYHTWRMEDCLLPLLHHGHPLVMETAGWILAKMNPGMLDAFVKEEKNKERKQFMKEIQQKLSNNQEGKLFQIEKVLLLKTVSIFNHTSEEILAEIANISEEVEAKAGEIIFSKGEEGDCMYIIYRGEVKVHDGEHVFATMRDRDFFGELSLLDPEPRSASITATQDTFLLKLNQETFYEIMADRIEVVKGILKILVQRLRKQNTQLASLAKKKDEGDE